MNDDASRDIGETLTEVVDRMVKRLRQHCDAVQVVAVKFDDESGDTHTVTDGAGNWQARCGAMRAWVIRAEEEVRHDARRVAESDD